MSDITIVTVNWFNVELITRMLKNLHAKARYPKNLSVLIIDNTNGQDKSVQNLKGSGFAMTILPLDNQGLKGSHGHALALNHARKHLESEYSVVVDPDIHMFRENWDVFCLSEMQKTGSIAIGAPYPIWKVGKYHEFPSPPFCFFHTRTIKKMVHGWEPYGTTVFHNAWTFIVRQIGRLGGLLTRQRFIKHIFLRNYAAFSEKIFGVFSQDTGWKLDREVKTKNLITVVFDAVFPEDNILNPDHAEDFFNSMVREFEVFSYKGELVLAHKYGTGGEPWRTERGSDFNHWLACIQKVEASLK